MTASSPRIDRPQAAQRIKVGLIGLGAVLLLIGLASAVFKSVNREVPVSAIGGAQPARVAEMANTAAPAAVENEPLAELGVAPPSSAELANRASRAR